LLYIQKILKFWEFFALEFEEPESEESEFEESEPEIFFLSVFINQKYFPLQNYFFKPVKKKSRKKFKFFLKIIFFFFKENKLGIIGSGI
jgi:hypothetical protein